MGPLDLSHLFDFQLKQDASLLVGFDTSDDAAIVRINDDVAIVLSADFITPVVNDPFTYGKIAAANALSDIFAMGAEVQSALNLFMWDRCHVDESSAKEILRGGLQKIQECGGMLVGGHTIADKEQKYGLSVIGYVHPSRYWQNHTLAIGDHLVLSKPLGSGILTTAIKNDLASESEIVQVSCVMETLNVYAARIAKKFNIHACTDITGFGLVGHSLEMLGDQKHEKTIVFDTAHIPIIESAKKYLQQDIIPGGSRHNYEAYHSRVKISSEYAKIHQMLFFDAQTSGGLLFALSHQEADMLVEDLKRAGIDARDIGEVVPYEHKSIVLG